MKKSSIIILVILCWQIFPQSLYAELKLPAIVSSNMVLQRNTTVQLWGWADPNEKITIHTSWLDKEVKTVTSRDGKWQVEVKTTNSTEVQKIKIRGKKDEITLEDVLFGEVWICSGQSNMEMPVKGYNGQPIYGSSQLISRSENQNLRLFTVKKIASKEALSDLEEYVSWSKATPETVSEFSAVGYMFGMQLQEILDVPVGLIFTAWGGSSVQAWMSKDVLKEYQQINLQEYDLSENTNEIPTALFNSMIHPLIPYTIKGAIWYQGETNRLEPERYKTLFPEMVKDWRNRWGIGDFPFYYVQIAPFYYYGNNDEFQTVHNSAFIREAQLSCLESIPNSGIAITMDIGDSLCIHPPRKREVADRLLYNALNQSYGYHVVDGISASFDSKIIQEEGILLNFKNAETGLYAFKELKGFEIAGKDKVFYPAYAKIVNYNQVFVQSKHVKEPVEVRYAWRNWVTGSLYDVNLLPVSSFRTDDWDDASRYSK